MFSGLDRLQTTSRILSHSSTIVIINIQVFINLETIDIESSELYDTYHSIICISSFSLFQRFLRIIMTTTGISSTRDLFMLKGKTSYDFLESEYTFEMKEIIRLQGNSSVRSLLHSHRHFLDFIHIESNDPNLITIKQLAGFRQHDGTWTVKEGIQYDAEQLMTTLNRLEERATTSQSDGSMLVSSDVLSRFPWLKNLIIICQNPLSTENRNDSKFLLSFV